LTPGDLNKPNPPGVWVGPRGKLYLPYLFMRANPGDQGLRPVVGHFWESPDILLLAGVHPSVAPPKPPKLGQTALAGQPNTIYAHLWNFGNCAAGEVLVEFYWCDPSMGIDPTTVRLIAQTTASLGAKGSGRAHAVVKCPEPWTPTFVNGGHECLLVRIWDNLTDLPGLPQIDASINRHVAQRNIHVIAPGAAMNAAPLAAGHAVPAAAPANPLLINVGPLYGSPAEVKVERVTPTAMPWLQLRTGVRGSFPAPAPAAAAPSRSPRKTASASLSRRPTPPPRPARPTSTA
jgi:hypothetical protein